jgi:hypothetical protein
MAAPLNPSLVVPIGVGALVLWRLYSRIRRTIGRQHLSNVRPWITISVFPVLVVLLATLSRTRPDSLLSLAGGLAVGVGLGIYGLRNTRFENTPEGFFYTPAAHLGIALSLLLVGRILYRMLPLYGLTGSTPVAAPPAQFATTPLSMLLFGTFAAYYVTYAIGLLRWRHAESTKPVGS